MKALLEKVKKGLRPDLKVLKEIDKAIEKINYLLKKEKVNAVCVRGGSTAKGTFLKNDYDVDLFVRFQKTENNISDLLESVLKKEFNVERVHGSRDYFQIKGDLLFEIVPVKKILDYREAENVTDMSPLHVDYVKKHVSKELADEIRLAKQFCKSAKVYGAESYIKGFSGHILDLLIIYHGSFEKFVKAAVNWKPKVIFDLEKHLKDPLKELDDAKIHSPLIIVDPVQPNRNAAAAMSKEKFDMFIERCKTFLLHPSEEFFKIKALSKDKVSKQVLPDEELFFFEVEPLKGKKDIVGAKIMKTYEYLRSHIKKNEFEIVKTGWEFSQKNKNFSGVHKGSNFMNKDKGSLYFILVKEELPSTMILSGPPIKQTEGVAHFKEKHKDIFEENGRLFAREKRKYRLAKDLIKDLLKDKYVTARVKKIIIC